MTARPYNRIRKSDRLLSPGATREEIECDFALGAFDEACRRVDRIWGIDRLPSLVPVEMAQRYGRAVAALNAAIEARDPDTTAQNAGNCVRALTALHNAAEAAGAPKADPTIWEHEVNGYRFGIIRDDMSWQAAKAARPDLQLRTMTEVANALQAYDHVVTGEVFQAVKQNFPNAKVTKIKPSEPVWDEQLGDCIPF